MNIEVRGKFKSITDLDWHNVPKFSIITGPNGVGKSQFLELLNIYFENGGVIPSNTYGNVTVRIQGLDNQIHARYLRSEWKFENIHSANFQNLQDRNLDLFNQYKDFIRNPHLRKPYTTSRKFTEINSILNKSYVDVSPEEFYSLLGSYFIEDERQFIAEHITNIFYNYRLDFIEKREKGISEEEIIQEIGEKPWVLINQILGEAKFPYKIHSPEDISLKERYTLKVISTLNDEFIHLENLSSGEKIILSLAFMLYNTTKMNVFPKVLLMDEPDAHLHPSLAKQFIDIVNNIFVIKYDINVIMTTHSPSTIAFAPENSIFEMFRDGDRIQKSTSKYKSISLLTSGIITVGPGSKFVLVEDNDDQVFYDTVYSILQGHNLLNPDISIIFIPSSYGTGSEKDSGGKTVVAKWVKKLTEAGMENTLQGLIDLDDGNDEEKNVHVLKRYSFENYLVDPILVFAALIDIEAGYTVPGIEIQLGEEQKLLSLSENELQSIVDKILSDVEPIVTGLDEDHKRLEDIEYIDGRKIKLPRWLLYKRGKDLMNYFSAIFDHRYVNKTSLLKMLRKLKIIPNDFIQIMRNIQNNNE